MVSRHVATLVVGSSGVRAEAAGSLLGYCQVISQDRIEWMGFVSALKGGQTYQYSMWTYIVQRVIVTL